MLTSDSCFLCPSSLSILARMGRGKRSLMAFKIIVGADEPIAAAVERFEQRRYFVYRRPWTKRRYGAFEKPSVVRRRAKRLRAMRRQGQGWFLRFPITLDAQMRRDEPANRVGR